MGDPATALRALVEQGPVLVPACYDGISAAVLEQAGFSALGVSGAGLAMSRLGVPDLGLLTLTELVESVRPIVRRAGVPVLVDADTGFGGALNVLRTVEELVGAGVAAIQLEDQVAPKRCGHLGGKAVVGAEEFVERIAAAVLGRGSSDSMIVARTDALAVHGIDDALERGRQAVAAGADLVFVEAPTSLEEVERIGAEFRGHALYNLATGGRSPALPVDRLGELGYGLVVCPTVALYPTVHALRAAAAELRRTGTDAHLQELDLSPAGLFDVVGLTGWLDLDARIARAAH
ncbi:oxaloacetate decarboxylase [Pseudonocardia sp. MH-G8]|uniref:isocitrate lyase/PEP mutase family protein n=1 Tax=Pseudonocardia sp. MH-G8 TaxID=1854588 RepID=UPI000B9FFF77|nr:isocitrate lyase/PEP mutase family protein [Pseudonocardia sp. MH-G8]OZM80827.1 carboxyvinyl-carboxyphosphonate phosphorylmutase [Pseudonocardia sp. MH-G8]